MSWTCVNVAAITPQHSQQIERIDSVPDEPPNVFASKYRVNILHAAERLSDFGPKRKRRALKTVVGEPVPQKVKRTKIAASTELATLDAHLAKTFHVEHAHSPQRRSTRLKSPTAESSRTLSSPLKKGEHVNTLQHDSLSIPKPPAGEDEVTDTVVDHLPAAHRFKDTRSGPASSKDTCTEVKASSASLLWKQPGLELISDDVSTNFDDFDDSVFDDPPQLSFDAEPSPRIPYSPATPVSLTDQLSPTPISHENVLSSQSEGRATHPNGAPFAPFMHPCLLDSLKVEAMALNKRDASTPSLKHTCFRAGELLQMATSFKSKHVAQDDHLIAELFATVKEVKYANSWGQGQGLELADVFFPSKPPFITASSRIPYNAKELTPQHQTKSGVKPPVRATIKISGTKTASAGRLAHSSSSPVKSSPMMLNEPILLLDAPTFEVADVHTSSWEEIRQAKQLIEKDLRARSKSTGSTKDSKTIIHRHWPKQAKPEKAKVPQKAWAIKAVGSEDQLRNTNEFPDEDFDLPEIEEIFKQASR